MDELPSIILDTRYRLHGMAAIQKACNAVVERSCEAVGLKPIRSATESLKRGAARGR